MMTFFDKPKTKTKLGENFRSSESRTLSLLNCYAECRRKPSSITDDKPRGEAEFTQTIPKYRANESRVKLAWLCRNIVQTRAESSLIGYAECS